MLSRDTVTLDVGGLRLAHRYAHHEHGPAIADATVIDGDTYATLLARCAPRYGGTPRRASRPGIVAAAFCSTIEATNIVAAFAPTARSNGRGASVATIEPEHVICALVARFVAAANHSLWHYPRVALSVVQALGYSPGDSLDWHCDGSLDARFDWLGFICALSDPADYTGGELQIGRDGEPLKLPQGFAVVLPGDVEHRVLPVTGGHRWSLTAFAASTDQVFT